MSTCKYAASRPDVYGCCVDLSSHQHLWRPVPQSHHLVTVRYTYSVSGVKTSMVYLGREYSDWNAKCSGKAKIGQFEFSFLQKKPTCL